MQLDSILSRIGDFTRDGIIIAKAEPIDAPGPRIEWCNAAICTMTGYTSNEILGRSPRLFQGPDTSVETRRQIRSCLAEWRSGRFEILNYRKCGTPFWVEIDITPVADDTGWFRYWVSVQREISERRQREHELDRTRGLAKAILEASSVGIWIAEPIKSPAGAIADFAFLEANPAAERLMQHSVDELRHGTLRSLFPGVVETGVFDAYARAVVSGEEQKFEVEYNKDGLNAWYRVTATATAEGLLSVGFDDIGPEKERERELELARLAAEDLTRRLALAARAAEIGFWEYMPETDTLFWDEGMQSLFHVSDGDLTETLADWERWLHPEDKEVSRDKLFQAIATGSDLTLSFRIVRSDGAIRHIMGRAARHVRGGQLTYLGVNWDATDLFEAVERAEAGARAKSAFLSNMSHEIRTPMNGMVGVADLLAQQPLTPQCRELVELIQSSSQDLLRIVDDILEFSRIESDRVRIERTTYAPAPLLERLERIYALKCQEKGLGFTIAYRGDATELRLGDPTRLIQILHNLLSNAVKFTEKGDVRLEVVFDAQGLRAEVADTGIGIDARDIAKLFQRFSQADETVGRRFGGAGLGLAISRGLARAMGGDIVAESAFGKGSLFCLTLPAPLVITSTRKIEEVQ